MATSAPAEIHAEALADLRRRHRRAKQYADEAAAVGDRRRLLRALRLYYQRAIQIEQAQSAPPFWECPQCLWGDEAWPRLDLRLRELWNCIAHYEDIAAERAAALLADQLEAIGCVLAAT